MAENKKGIWQTVKESFTNHGVPSSVANAYAVTGSVVNWAILLTVTQLTFFCTDVVGLSIVQMTVTLTIARIIDMVVAAFCGMVMQRVKLKWGPVRSWLVIFPLIMFFGCMLEASAFLVPSDMAKILMISVGYILAQAATNFNNAVRNSLLGALASNQDSRFALSFRTNILNTFLAMFITSYVLTFAVRLGDLVGSLGWGFFIMVLALNLLNVAMQLWLFWASRKVDTDLLKPVSRKKKEKVSVVKAIGVAFQNKYLLLLLACQFLTFLAIYVSAGLGTYYWMYVIGDVIFQGYSNTVGNVAQLIGLLLIAPVLSKKLGAAGSNKLMYFVLAAQNIICWFLGARTWLVYCVTFAIYKLIGSVSSAWGMNLWVQAGEYGYWKTGVDNRIYIASLQSLPSKITVFISTFIISWALASVGYTPGMEITSAFTNKLLLFYFGIPGILYLIEWVLYMCWRLNDQKMDQIIKENEARRAAEAAAAQE